MLLPQEPEKELYWRSEKTGPVKNKDGVYEYWWDRNDVSKGGGTPDPPVTIDGFWENLQTQPISC